MLSRLENITNKKVVLILTLLVILGLMISGFLHVQTPNDVN